MNNDELLEMVEQDLQAVLDDLCIAINILKEVESLLSQRMTSVEEEALLYTIRKYLDEE